MKKTQLVFATSNKHKMEEVAAVLNMPWLDIKTLAEIDFIQEIEETGATLEENAWIKTNTIKDLQGGNVFSEDTGLEVYALNMEPGVITARYAGVERDPIANMEKLLAALSDKGDRRARFRTALALVWEGEKHLFEGIVEGVISNERRGEGGFGYDPIFIPEGYDKTFAELGEDIKNEISHRARAVAQLKAFLKKIESII